MSTCGIRLLTKLDRFSVQLVELFRASVRRDNSK